MRLGSGQGWALPTLPPERDREPGGAPLPASTPCPGLTGDGVGVVVPGLLCDVEDAGGHRPCPAWQFAVEDHDGGGQGSAQSRIWLAGTACPVPPGPALPDRTALALGPHPLPRDFPKDTCHLLRTITCTPGPCQGPLLPPQDPHLSPRVPILSPAPLPPPQAALTLLPRDPYPLSHDPKTSPGPGFHSAPIAPQPSTPWLPTIPGQDQAPQGSQEVGFD